MILRHRKVTASYQILSSHLEFLAQLAHGRYKHKSVKITAVPFKSSGITGSKAETDSKENEKTNTKQNGDVRGNTPGITRLLHNRTDSIQQDRP